MDHQGKKEETKMRKKFVFRTNDKFVMEDYHKRIERELHLLKRYKNEI